MNTADRYHDEARVLTRALDIAAEIAATPPADRRRVEDPDTAVAIVAPMLEGAPREHAISLTLDTKHRVIAVRIETVGSVDHTFMTPRELLRSAIMDNAAALMVFHNHPSGDPEPSRDDESVTRRLAEAARIVGVELLDHIVLGAPARDAWVSMARRGHI